MKRHFVVSLVFIATLAVTTVAPATPLPKGTLLSITPGNYATCATEGSCWAGELAPGFWLWFEVAPGTDGGLIVGKNQISGGQETCNGFVFTPGELTAAWSWTGDPGTFATAPLMGCYEGNALHDASYNVFDDASCAGASCLGKTVLGTLNAAFLWRAGSWGSADGCQSAYCTAEQLAGVFISEWTLNPDGTYVLDYRNTISADASVFSNLSFRLVLRGKVIRNLAPVAGNLSFTTQLATTASWIPQVSDANGDPLTCRLGTPPTNGVAAVAADCSSGTYTSDVGFIGTDSFSYIANDGQADSNPGTVTVAVTEPAPGTVCTGLYPVTQFIQTGKQGTLSITFTGNITSHTNKEVKVCPGTTLSYTASSTKDLVKCKVKNSLSSGSGTLRIRDHLKCTDKPGGKDKVQFKVKSGVTK